MSKVMIKSRFGGMCLEEGVTPDMKLFSRICAAKMTGATTNMSKGLIDMLIDVGERFGEAITIYSGYRAGNGVHGKGQAVDIIVGDVPLDVVWVFCYEAFPYGGVGYYPNSNHVHIDCRGYRARWVHTDGIGEKHIPAKHKLPLSRVAALYQKKKAQQQEKDSTFQCPHCGKYIDVSGGEG